MNTLLENMQDHFNYGLTENGGVKHNTTKSAVLDMFALCGSYRNRSDEDCILAFKEAFEENEELALKCLFYLRDVRGGAGERRFFRVCFKWLANAHPDAARRNLINISEYGRWDDLIYSTIDTKVIANALEIIRTQLILDMSSKTPSLLGKWLPSENSSSKKTKKAGNIIREYLKLSHKEYRKTLSTLRSRINIVEKLMSENRWDEIQFDKIPSKAGLIYRNAFARRDIIAKKYESFIKDDNAKINADALYPYELVRKAREARRYSLDNIDRLAINKYWENQKDYLNGQPCKMICVCDTSGSMTWTNSSILPIDVAIGLSMYCAERVGGPFKNHYISFASRPQLIQVKGVDFVDKVKRIYDTNLCDNTDLVRTFDLLLDLSLKARPEDRLDTVVVISDMEIDAMSHPVWDLESTMTEMEKVRLKWTAVGIECPKLVYWNVDARNNTILDLGPNVSFVSGASPSIFESILTGKTGYDLMLEKLVYSGRYDVVK